ncbi:MAG: YiaA/YiaB family inner membrane protein, partial [Methylocella sp.]
LGMGIMLLIQSCITLTKTMRDSQEAQSLVNRIEDAKTERLLMDVAKVS